MADEDGHPHWKLVVRRSLAVDRLMFRLLVTLLVLNVLQVFSHLALDAFRDSAHIGEQSVEDVELFRQLFDAFLETFVISHQKFDFFFRFSRAKFRLFPRFSHRDVVPLPTATVLVRPLISSFTSARSARSAAATATLRRGGLAHRRRDTFDGSRTVAGAQDFPAAGCRRVLASVRTVVSRVTSSRVVLLRWRTVRARIQRLFFHQTAVRMVRGGMVLLLLLLLMVVLLGHVLLLLLLLLLLGLTHVVSQVRVSGRTCLTGQVRQKSFAVDKTLPSAISNLGIFDNVEEFLFGEFYYLEIQRDFRSVDIGQFRIGGLGKLLLLL